MPIKLLFDMAVRYALGRFGAAGRSGGSATGASFVGALALAGLVVSIAVLVFVISVVNGFEREMRERLLNVLPHITATSLQGAPLADIPAEVLEEAKAQKKDSAMAQARSPIPKRIMQYNGKTLHAQVAGISSSSSNDHSGDAKAVYQ